MAKAEELLRKAYLLAAAYVLVLIIGLGFVFNDVNLPVWLEFFLKISAAFAGIILVTWFVFYLVQAFLTRRKRLPFMLAALGQLATAFLLVVSLLYIKIKTCTPPDSYSQWYCRVEGKSVFATGLALLFLSSITGLLLGYIYELLRRPKQ